jgi:hypothetical protein
MHFKSVSLLSLRVLLYTSDAWTHYPKVRSQKLPGYSEARKLHEVFFRLSMQGREPTPKLFPSPGEI